MEFQYGVGGNLSNICKIDRINRSEINTYTGRLIFFKR